MKFSTLLLPFCVPDMIYQNRLGNNRMIEGLRLSAPFGMGLNKPLSEFVEFFADNFEKSTVREAAKVMVKLYSKGGKVEHKSRRGRHFMTRKMLPNLN